MPQTSVLNEPARRFAGMITKPMDPVITQSSIVAEGPLAPAHLALVGTTPAQGVGVSDGAAISAATVRGIVKLQVQRPLVADAVSVAAGTVPGYANRTQLTLVQRGPVALPVVAAVTRGSQVFVGNTTATLNQYRGSAAVGFEPVPGATFTEDGAIDDLVEAKVDFL